MSGWGDGGRSIKVRGRLYPSGLWYLGSLVLRVGPAVCAHTHIYAHIDRGMSMYTNIWVLSELCRVRTYLNESVHTTGTQSCPSGLKHLFVCVRKKDTQTHTHTGFMRLCCWLFTGSALLYLLSITADCWPCLALLGQNHVLCCPCVFVCAHMCVTPSSKTHLPINLRWFNVSPYLLSLPACVACFNTHLWGIKYINAMPPQRSLKGWKEKKTKQKHLNEKRNRTSNINRRTPQQLPLLSLPLWVAWGSTYKSPPPLHDTHSPHVHPLAAFPSQNTNQTSYQPIKQTNLPQTIHLITPSK